MELPSKILILTTDEEIKLHLNAQKMSNVLTEFDNYLREQYKYHGVEAAYDFRLKLGEIATENNLYFDELNQ